MKIEIVKVEELEFQAIDIMHIYPHDRKQLHHYRRYNRPDHWCSFLGDNHGWKRVEQPIMLEDAYQRYMRKQKQKKRGQK